jgi:antitoxin component YwqK of YwqJK toxin-antitoxin module
MGSIKTISIFILVVVTSSFGIRWVAESKSEVVINESELILNAQKGLFIYNESPFTGTAISADFNEMIIESASFKDGKRHGLITRFFPNGVKSYESNYQNGRIEGKSFSWWSNSNLRSESTYIDGELAGVQRKWYTSGAQFKETNIENGLEVGLQRAWRENGKLYVNYEAKNGRVFGLQRANLCYELDSENLVYAENSLNP